MPFGCPQRWLWGRRYFTEQTHERTLQTCSVAAFLPCAPPGVAEVVDSLSFDVDGLSEVAPSGEEEDVVSTDTSSSSVHSVAAVVDVNDPLLPAGFRVSADV